MLINDEVFVQEKFKEQAIQKKSRILNYQVDIDTPIWIEKKIQKELLNDETSFMKLG